MVRLCEQLEESMMEIAKFVNFTRALSLLEQIDLLLGDASGDLLFVLNDSGPPIGPSLVEKKSQVIQL